MFSSLLAAFSFPMLLGSLTIQSYICQPPVVPVFTNPADGSTVVSGTEILFSGTSTPDSTVTLDDNGQTLATATADQDKSFSIQTSLEAGNHTIGITASNPCGTKSGTSLAITSSAATSVSSPTQPSTATTPRPSSTSRPTSSTKTPLGITTLSPQNGLRTTESSVFVSGTTSLPSSVRISIGDKTIGTIDDFQTEFGLSVPLSLGDTTFTITVTAKDGSTSSQTITIKRTDDTPLATITNTVYNTATSVTRSNVVWPYILSAVLIILIWWMWIIWIFHTRRHRHALVPITKNPTRYNGRYY